MAPPPVLVALLIAGGLSSPYPFQERVLGRQTIRGRATLADGGPWPNARITLLSRPVPRDERFGEADVVTATADAQGAFRAQVLPARHYTAWAVEAIDETSYRVSEGVEGVSSGRSLAMVGRPDPSPVVRVAVRGLEAWKGRGEIVVRALTSTHNRIVEPCQPLADGTWQMPPLPGHRAELEVLCGGQPLLPWPTAIDLTRREPQEVTKVFAPRAVLLRVVGEDGKPVAGARAFQSALDPPGGEREPLHEVGRSDASGWLEVTLPMGSERDFDWVNYPWLVTAPGLAPLGHIERFPVPREHDPVAARTREAPAATLRLRPGMEVRGRLADCPGGTLLHVRTRVVSTGSSIRPTILPVPTAADGTFSVVLDDRFGGAILACPDGETLSRRNARSETSIAPVIVLAVIPPARGKPVDLGPIRFDDLLALDLRAVPRDGSVAESPTVALGLAGKDGPQTLVRGIATDRLGRSRLLVPATEDLIAAAWTRGAFGMAKPVFGQHEASCTVTLADAALLPGSVRDAAGHPVSHARVVFWLWSNDTAHANAFLAQAIHVLEPRTDAEGRFELMLLPGVTQSFTAVHTGKGEHFLQGIEPFTGDKAPERLDIQLGR